ncbi:hypothetical protein P4234_13325 [Pseudomonas aeruginosa]|nr:hypothetical protein [Pseudomonas aeruginosa]
MTPNRGDCLSLAGAGPRSQRHLRRPLAPVAVDAVAAQARREPVRSNSPRRPPARATWAG